MGITSRMIDAAERKVGQSLDYIRDIAKASPAAVYKLGLFGIFAWHRKAAPLEAYYLASIGALQHEDCGPCLQIVVDQAIAAGVDGHVVSAALGDGSELRDQQRLYRDFGRAVAANAPEAEELRQEVAKRLSQAAMVDLAIGIASARVPPALKRSLGRAQSCSVVKVKVRGQQTAEVMMAQPHRTP